MASHKISDDDGNEKMGVTAAAPRPPSYTVEHHFDHEMTLDTEGLEEWSPPNMTKLQVILLNLTYLGINVVFLLLSVEVVPAQVEALVGQASKGRWLGALVAGGAAFTLVFGPLIGMRSDRLVSRFGRRRPIMLMATFFLCVGMAGLAFTVPHIKIENEVKHGQCDVDLVARRCAPYTNQSLEDMLEEPDIANVLHPGVPGQADEDSVEVSPRHRKHQIGLYTFFFFLVMSSNTALMVPYNALVADMTPTESRGISSGVMGFMILTGNIIGAIIGLFFTDLGVLWTYVLIACILTFCLMATLISIPEEPSFPLHEPVNWKKITMGFWEPLLEHDFRWVFITRFLMQQGLSTVLGFLEYWLGDIVMLPYCWSASRAVSVMLLPLLITAAIASMVCGMLSDKLGKRKHMVMVSAMIMSAVCVMLSFIRGPYAFYFATFLAFIFGLGFGCYQAVDFALLMDVLPAARDTAKDIAVWHQALVIPQAVATPLGGVLLDLFESINCQLGLGYIMVFVVTGIYFFFSALLVAKIRNAE